MEARKLQTNRQIITKPMGNLHLVPNPQSQQASVRRPVYVPRKRHVGRYFALVLVALFIIGYGFTHWSLLTDPIATQKTYTVEAGDTVWSVAEKTCPASWPMSYAMSWMEQKNPKLNTSQDVIYPGEVLYVPQ